MMGEYFHVRRLIWDDICQHIRPSEANELRLAIGNRLIDENEELKEELNVLVEILSEYQQQSDGIREVLVKRRDHRAPEPPGRALLLEKLKLLATDLRASNAEHRMLQSPKENAILQYVLAAEQQADDDDGDGANGGRRRGDEETKDDFAPPLTPRMADLRGSKELPALSARDAVVLLRPGTSSGKRPVTATSSQGRPVSRGSTLSNSSTASSIVESPEVRQRLNVDEIDSIKDDVQDALKEETHQLLEDIEFLQSCIEMEQELLDDDRRQISSARPPPTLQELQHLRRVLEQTLEDQANVDRVESILSRTTTDDASGSSGLSGRPRRGGSSVKPVLHTVGAAPAAAPAPLAALPILPRPPPRASSSSFGHHHHHQYDPYESSQDHDHYEPRQSRASGSSSASTSTSNSSSTNSCTRVLKIRHAIQEARDEPFLS